MDKQQEAQADSISAVGVQIKPDYPPSEVYGSEPPPAYQRPRPTAVQIARIAAVTLVAVSFILGFFMVASAYITATATCYQDYPATPEHVEDRPVFQALVDPLETEESSHTKRESAEPPSRSHQQHEQQSEDRDEPIHLKLPLQLDFDELAGSMIEKNQRSRMNCVVEKRRAEEVMDHQPKTVRLPFGVNLTTDPRYEHITGERMAIFCESGNDQSNGGSEIHNVPVTPKINPKQSRKWATENFLTSADDIDMEYGPISSDLSNEVEDDSATSNPRPIEMTQPNEENVVTEPLTPVDEIFPSFRPFFRHVPMEQEQNVPMMQMHVVPIQVQQIPLHPNAIPHGPHPIHVQHQAPQQGRPLPHMMAPHMNPQSVQMAQMPQMPQQPQQMHPHFQQIPAGELPPQVLQAVQEQLAAEQQMAAQQHMAQQNRRFPPQAQIIPDSAEQVFIQEEIIPILHQHGHPRAEGRSMEGSPVLQAIEAVEQHPVPSDTVKPPPPPAFTPLRAADRPHYVQPRSIRDVSSLLKREKRVRRCACDCSC